MRDLQKYYSECVEMLDDIGIDYGRITEIKINTRAKTRWGQCRRTYNGYSINISSILLDDRIPVEALNNTIIHEILHTCPGCMNHGKEWKNRAAKVKQMLGYDIKRCNGAEEKHITREISNDYQVAKYVVRCKKCGREVNHYRMCSIVKHPCLWRCGVCGGEFERVV